MARPRYRGNDKTALDKMEQAFWDSMREGPYSDITIASIVRKAGVNRNTFYYHYRDIDEMSRSIVTERLLDPMIPQLVTRFSQSGEAFPFEFLEQDGLDERLMHVGLMASDNSAPQLRALLKETVKRIWCDYLGISLERLDLIDQLLLEFTLGGMLSLIASYANRGEYMNPQMAADLRIQTLIKQNYARLAAIAESTQAAYAPSSSGSM